MDTPWAQKKRSHLRLVLFIVIFSVLGLYLGIKMYQPPSCFDNKLNQDEQGKDCGGSCELYCPFQVQDMHVEWVKAFEVSPGWWSAVAYVQNPNVTKQVRYAPYRFSVYDAAGGLILERTGATFINREPIVPVFEGRLNIGDKKPYRTTFEWLGVLDWYVARSLHMVTTEEPKLISTGVGHDVHVVLRNNGPEPLRDVEVVAMLYDKQENVIAVSETYLDLLNARGKADLLFSWPRPFAGEVGRMEFIPRVREQAR